MTDTSTSKIWCKAADRPLRSWRKSVGIWLFARFVGVPVPWGAVRQTNGAALLAYEHDRLLALAAAGEAVPPVLDFDGHTLQTGDIGTTLDHQLYRTDPTQRLALMCAASADLARFHARGQWHGGAQSRNITWNGERFARLDFEEALVPDLPLAVVQRYDALQLLLSLAGYLVPLGPAAVAAVLEAYEQAAADAAAQAPVPKADVRAFVAHLLPRLRRVERWSRWSPRINGSRELMRLRTVLDGMSTFVQRAQAVA